MKYSRGHFLVTVKFRVMREVGLDYDLDFVGSGVAYCNVAQNWLVCFPSLLQLDETNANA